MAAKITRQKLCALIRLVITLKITFWNIFIWNQSIGPRTIHFIKKICHCPTIIRCAMLMDPQIHIKCVDEIRDLMRITRAFIYSLSDEILSFVRELSSVLEENIHQCYEKRMASPSSFLGFCTKQSFWAGITLSEVSVALIWSLANCSSSGKFK